MKKFLIVILFMIMSACSVSESEYDYSWVSLSGGAVYYGTQYAFSYGDTFVVGTMTWTRYEEISSDTYIYKSTVSTDNDTSTDSFQAEEGSTTYVPDQQDPLDENPNIPQVTSNDTTIFYMKVRVLSSGVALHSVTTSYENAVSSTGYQLYTYYRTSSPSEYYTY